MNGIPALNDTSYSFVANPEVHDRDANGLPEMKIVFDRESVQSVLSTGDNYVTVTGTINDIFFVGTGVMAVYTTSKPKATISANTTSGNAPLTVAFTSTNTGYPDTSFWDFGDGDYSYDQNPVHVYKTRGSKNVSLTVSNDNGIVTVQKQNYITVVSSITPEADFTVNSTSTTLPFVINFTDTSTNAPTRWLWQFGDSGNSTEKNPIHTYYVPGNFTVILEVSNENGSDKKFQILTIPNTTSLPIANFTVDKKSGLSPLTVAFNDTSLNATSWFWDFGDGTNTTARNPIHTYSYGGNYTVQLTASNTDGRDTVIVKDFISVIRPRYPVANFVVARWGVRKRRLSCSGHHPPS